MKREDSLKVQEQFSRTNQFTTIGIFLDGIDCKILLGSGATKSFMSKQYYLRNKSFHGLTNVSSYAEVIQVRNVASINILFVIPIVITMQGHMFEIYTEVH